ncbi:MAG: hypothetical protein ABIU09_12780 [Pyrinomonadaceae bacterium]
MTAKAKKILITTESHEVFVIRHRDPVVSIFCPSCGEQLRTTDFELASCVHSTHNSGDPIGFRRSTDELKKEE